MTRRHVLIAAWGLACILPSCASRDATIELNTDLVPAQALVARVEAKAHRLRSLVGRGSMTFDSPRLSGSAFFSLSVRKPDSLLVRLEGPFGIDLGTLFLSRDRFVLYNSMENRVMTGDPAAASFRALLPFDLSYDQMMDAFTGGFGFVHEGASLTRYEVDGEQFHLTYALGDRTCDYWIDPEYLTIAKQQIRNSDREIVMETVSSSVMEEEDVCAPRRVTVSFPEEHRQLSVVYSNLDLNVAEVPFDYTIPPSARTYR